MINRRHLRIKVMQTMYGFEQNHAEHPVSPDNIGAGLLEENLFHHIKNVYLLYFYHFLFIQKIAEYVRTDARMRVARLLVTEENKKFGTKIFDNTIIHFLRTHPVFNEIVEREKLARFIDENLIKKFYSELVQSETYKKYISTSVTDLSSDKEIIAYLYKNILLASDLFQHHLEDAISTWLDDKEVVIHSVTNTIKNFTVEKSDELDTFISDFKSGLAEEKKFTFELLHTTIQHNEELSRLIEPKLTNWDVKRIAQIDLILMKMALCEMLYFDSIPVKVSINEYIDISKLYSTPKSREFINGILDKLMKELKETGKIVKTGRGLVE